MVFFKRGLIKPKLLGLAFITAIAVLVISGCPAPVVPVTGVDILNGDINLAVGEYAMLTVTVISDYATDKTVSWSTSNSSIAKIIVVTDEDCSVTAVSVGTATITVTTNDGGKTASITVTVY